MVSTVIHISFGIIIACALVPLDKFSLKSVSVVVFTVALVDSDSFAFIIESGLHRTLFHNIFIPSVILLCILYDIVYRDKSFIGKYYSKEYILVISSVSYIAVIFAGIGLDLVNSGVNLFWPLHDQFYTMKGQFVISSEEGVIQTFTDVFFEEKSKVKTTENHVYHTPVNTDQKSDPRIFNIAYKGWQIIVILTAFVTVSLKKFFAKFEQ